MRTAKLQALGIEVPLADNEFYHDDGFVDDIAEHSLELSKKYYGEDVVFERDYEEAKSRYENTDGLCYIIEEVYTPTGEWKKETHHHIYYLHRSLNISNLMTRAHEETHALENMGKLNLLTKIILEEQGVRINFEEIEDEELKAEIGVVYILYKNKIPINPSLATDPDNILHQAIKRYEQGRIK